jgi:hypothetical protein
MPRIVLLIEDNPMTRKVVRLTLGSEGLTVLEASDGAEGIAIATKTPPDLILQDLLLPDMDGFELVARLRALPQTLGVPIIAFSGFLSRLECGHAAAAGFTDLLPKPVEPSRLLAVVRAQLPRDTPTEEKFGEGRRVLVVDDDPVQLKLVRIRLTGLGFDVRTAEDGAAALDALRQGGIDVVVSDVLMPRIDGFRLAAAIRKDPVFSNVPVVLVSSNYVEEADRQVGTSMGANAFVVRTPDLAEVLKALKDVVVSARPAPTSVHSDPADHHDRVIRQLERQAAMNAAFLHRMSMHASMLSVVAGISEALTNRHTVDGSLPDVLASLLEASGLSRGALFLSTPSGTAVGSGAGDVVLAAIAGFPGPIAGDLETFCGHQEMFERMIASKAPVVLNVAEADAAQRDFLRRADSESALLVPFFADAECFGIVLGAAKHRDLTSGDWIPFARTMAVQIGQSLALSRAFSKLAASEARYRRMIETTNQGVWLIDAERKTTFVNTRMAEMLGHPAEEILGRSPNEYLDAAGLADFREHSEHHEAGRHSQAEIQLFRGDGTSLWTLLESSPMLDDAGKFNGAFAMVMDITQRRAADEARVHAEQALRASEEQYRVLFENSPLPKWLYDLETLRFLAVNDAAIRMYGYSREEFLAMTIKDIRPPEDVPLLMDVVAKPLGDGQIGVWRHKKKDGTLVEVELHGHTFEQDGATRRLIVAQDVGDRRRLEEQLRQAQKMEAVGRLAGGVAHDFNNILSVILSYGEMLMADLTPTEPIREDIDQIVKAALRAADLTRQLLMFSRQQVVDPKVLDLNDVLKSIDKMLRRVLGADIDLTFVPGKGLGRVRADPGSIDQVVMNLVVNARDAMPTGGKLTIETSNVVLDEAYARRHAESQPGPHVMLAVTDTGIGMDAATRTRIFEPFFTTKDKGKGTGLGLSTVFGIVRQSGGTVWVYSEPGKGTTFKVFLPRVDAKLDPMASEPPLAAMRGTETILLVDDDDQVRLVTRSILQKNGYHVIVARNAGEALLHAESHAGVIHLLVTDVVMPQMSGPALAQRLAASRPEMKVLCMSGYTDDSIVRHGVIDGHIAFLQKPVTPQALAKRVRAVLDGNG